MIKPWRAPQFGNGSAEINPLLLLLEEQAAQIDALEDQKHDLQLALGFDKASNVQAAFGISETLAKMTLLLAGGTVKTKDQLHAGLYFQEPENSQPDRKILDTLACKLRKHLRPFGVDLETVWSGGLRISEGLEVVRAAVEHGSLDELRAAQAARQRKRERERMWRKAVRAAQGGRDRQTYLQQSLTRLKPWQELGISRRTWYRRIGTTRQTAANDDVVVPRRITVAA